MPPPPGWSLDVHHAYDPNDGVLHRGDGSDLSSTDIGAVVSPVFPDPSDNSNLGDFAVAPDGSLYYLDTSSPVSKKQTGIIYKAQLP